jgi:hypothetical protein
VSAGSSEKKGGYPTNISYNITPSDHQSTDSSYPPPIKIYIKKLLPEQYNQEYLL